MASTSSSVFVFTANSLKGKTSTSSTSHFQSSSQGKHPSTQTGLQLTPEDSRRSSRIQELPVAPWRRTSVAEFEYSGVGTSFDEQEDDVPDLDYFDVSSSVQSDVLAGDSLEERISRWVKIDDLDENSGDPEEELPLLVLKNGSLEESNLKQIDEEPAFDYYHNQYDEEEVPDLESILINPLAANIRWSPVLPGHGVGLVRKNALEAADHFGEHTLFTASLFDEDLNPFVHSTIMPNQLQSVCDDNIVESRSEASHVMMLSDLQAGIKTRPSLPSRNAITLKAEPDRTSNKLHLVDGGEASPALVPATVTSQAVISPNQSPKDFDPGGQIEGASEGEKFREKAHFASRLKKNVISSRASNDATAHAEGAGKPNSAAVKYGQKRRQRANYGVSEANLITCKLKECVAKTRRMQQQLPASKEFTRTERIHERSLELNWAFYKQYGIDPSHWLPKILKTKTSHYWRGRRNFHCKKVGMLYKEGLS